MAEPAVDFGGALDVSVADLLLSDELELVSGDLETVKTRLDELEEILQTFVAPERKVNWKRRRR